MVNNVFISTGPSNPCHACSSLIKTPVITGFNKKIYYDEGGGGGGGGIFDGGGGGAEEEKGADCVVAAILPVFNLASIPDTQARPISPAANVIHNPGPALVFTVTT